MTSFAADIVPLFRPKDVMAMAFMLDLTDHEEVRENADAVLETVADGSMPCDAHWPEERVAVLRAWVEEGCPA